MPRRPRQPRHPAPPTVEALEPRRLLAADPVLLFEDTFDVPDSTADLNARIADGR